LLSRSRIIFGGAEAAAASAPNLMLNIDGLPKISKTEIVSYFSHSLLQQFKSYKNKKYMTRTYVLLCLFLTVVFVYSRVEAGAAEAESKFLPRAGAV
jgi:hypothetical protein